MRSFISAMCSPRRSARAHWLRLLRRLVATCVAGPVALVSTACGGGDGGSATGTGDGRTPRTGSLAITVAGLPTGAPASLAITGPAGFSRALTATETLTGLVPGVYDVTAGDVMAGEDRFGATEATQHLTIVPGRTLNASVNYAILTGTISVQVSGIPGASLPDVAISGPAGLSRTVKAGGTVGGLVPGTYVLSATSVVVDGHTYAPATNTIEAIVPASTIPVPASFTYAIASGALTVSIGGLPAGTTGTAIVTGPGGFRLRATSGATLSNLVPGSYTITGDPVVVGTDEYRAGAPLVLQVAPSTVPIAAAVQYALATGSIAISISGLPAGLSPTVTVTGPNAYSRVVTSSSTLPGVPEGSYLATASRLVSGNVTYTPTPTSQEVPVRAGATSMVAVAYSAGAAPPPPDTGVNLTIEGFHVQQVVQRYAGSVPLIAGRDGLLRVFVKASGTNSASPAVRVRLYHGLTLTSTVTINAPTASVPQSITEGTLASSWNYPIPGSLLQPGLRILADVDPGNAVAESAEGDNSFPASGTPQAMDVRSVPPFAVRFVPVLQSVNGMQGGVTADNAQSYLAQIRALFPLGAIDADVRSPFTTAAPALQSVDGNGAWSQVLSEVNALRAADGSARYYYGVVKVGYHSGIAGLGYVPGRAAVGWDYLPSGNEVMAHEVGHNFGRFHAPGCGAGSPDASYPHAEGKIGVYGYDRAGNALRAPSTHYDLMGYCTRNWISDYTYSAIMHHRAADPFVAAASFAAGGYARRGLLVWGRVQRGRVVLEPAFEVEAPPSLPATPGPHRLQGFGAMGEVLFDLRFDGERIADHPDPTARHFAFVVPLDATRGATLTRLRAASSAREVEVTSAAPATGGGGARRPPTVERLDARRLRVRWDDRATRGLLVRHPRTGEILAFARGGEAVVYTSESSLDLTSSDGVRSTDRRRVGTSSGGRAPLR